MLENISNNFLRTTIPYLGISFLDIIFFIAVIVVGLTITKIVTHIIKRFMDKAGASPLIRDLLVSITKTVGVLVTVLSALPFIGIDTSTIGIGLSAIAAFIIGFGLQDTWANLAAGVWLSINKPFRKGDYVKVAGLTGYVESIGVMSTILRGEDNTTMIIPNKKIWGSPIINYTYEEIHRIEVLIAMKRKKDIEEITNTILEAIITKDYILKDPRPRAQVLEVTPDKINLKIYLWVKTRLLNEVKDRILDDLRRILEEKGIEYNSLK